MRLKRYRTYFTETIFSIQMGDKVGIFLFFSTLIPWRFTLKYINSIKCNKLYATVPLNLWYSKAFRDIEDERARHFHEFKDWQFDWLLEKSGWNVVRKEKWINPSFVPGIRPILRNFTNRYYAIEAIKK